MHLLSPVGEVVSFPTLVFPTEYVRHASQEAQASFWLTTVPRSLDATHDRQVVVVSVSTHRQVEWQTSDLISEHFSMWFYEGEAAHPCPWFVTDFNSLSAVRRKGVRGRGQTYGRVKKWRTAGSFDAALLRESRKLGDL